MKSETKWKFFGFTLTSILGAVIFGWVGIFFLWSAIPCNEAWDICLKNSIYIGIATGTILGALLFTLLNVKDYKKAGKRMGWVALAIALLFLGFLIFIVLKDGLNASATESLLEIFLSGGSYLLGFSGLMIFISFIPAALLGLIFTKFKK